METNRNSNSKIQPMDFLRLFRQAPGDLHRTEAVAAARWRPVILGLRRRNRGPATGHSITRIWIWIKRQRKRKKFRLKEPAAHRRRRRHRTAAWICLKFRQIICRRRRPMEAMVVEEMEAEEVRRIPATIWISTICRDVLKNWKNDVEIWKIFANFSVLVHLIL